MSQSVVRLVVSGAITSNVSPSSACRRISLLRRETDASIAAGEGIA